MVQSFGKFLLVGGFSTALQYLILVLLVHFFSAIPTLASSLGYIMSALVNYLLNRRLTFQSDSPHRRAAPRFIFVVLSGLLLNGTIMWIGTDLFNNNYVIVQVFATVIVLIFNYTAHKTWSFSMDHKT